MAKKSHRRKGDEGGSAKAVDPNLALFASRVKEEEAREKAEKAAARAERRAAAEHQRLVEAKEAAAAELKRLRRQGGAGAERVAQADRAYREALAALITHETGEAPHWAPEQPEDTPDSGVVPNEGSADVDHPSDQVMESTEAEPTTD